MDHHLLEVAVLFDEKVNRSHCTQQFNSSKQLDFVGIKQMVVMTGIAVVLSQDSNAKRNKNNKRKHTYRYSVITMVLKSAGSALDCYQQVKADGFDEGRLLIVKIRPDRGTVLFVSNLYNHVAAEGKQQQALLDQLGARLLRTESLGHFHLAGGDYNASLFPNARKGYSNSSETKEADLRFQNSPSTLSAQSLGGQATFKKACSHDVACNLLRQLD